MTVTFGVSAWAGPNVRKSDDDEGERARAFMSDVLLAAQHHGLSASINNVHPEAWAPVNKVRYVPGDPAAPTDNRNPSLETLGASDPGPAQLAQAPTEPDESGSP